MGPNLRDPGEAGLNPQVPRGPGYLPFPCHTHGVQSDLNDLERFQVPEATLTSFFRFEGVKFWDRGRFRRSC